MLTVLHIGGVEGLHWSPHPDIVILCVGLVAGYWYVAAKVRPRLSDAGRVKRSQVALFLAGVLWLYAAGGPPLHDLADNYLMTAHMAQHVILTLIAAPLLLAGTPGWFWEILLRDRRVLSVARVITKPLLAFSIFNATLLLTHLPPAIDLQQQQHVFHFFIHAVLLGSGLLMWWPILSTTPKLPAITYPLQMAYLFLQSVLPAVMASFITFADTVVYDFYADAPRIWNVSAIEDQQIAGGMMKLVGSMILWSFMALAFFRWYESERAEERGPRWREAEEELTELGLTEPKT